MKKIYGIVLILTAVLLVGCSDTQKAKSLAKKYLAKNSNDGKIEIVECGELQDYVFIDDFFKKLALQEEEQWVSQAEAELDIAEIWRGQPEAKEHLDLVDIYLAKADSVKKAAESIKVDTFNIKRMTVKARGNNALGNKVVDDIVLFFDKDIKHCDQSANDIAHGLVK